jgi:hypothetical protein
MEESRGAVAPSTEKTPYLTRGMVVIDVKSFAYGADCTATLLFLYQSLFIFECNAVHTTKMS